MKNTRLKNNPSLSSQNSLLSNLYVELLRYMIIYNNIHSNLFNITAVQVPGTNKSTVEKI